METVALGAAAASFCCRLLAAKDKADEPTRAFFCVKKMCGERPKFNNCYRKTRTVKEVYSLILKCFHAEFTGDGTAHFAVLYMRDRVAR